MEILNLLLQTSPSFEPARVAVHTVGVWKTCTTYMNYEPYDKVWIPSSGPCWATSSEYNMKFLTSSEAVLTQYDLEFESIMNRMIKCGYPHQDRVGQPAVSIIARHEHLVTDTSTQHSSSFNSNLSEFKEFSPTFRVVDPRPSLTIIPIMTAPSLPVQSTCMYG